MPQLESGESPDQVSEMERESRPRGLEDVLDRESLKILESLDLNSFENLLNAFDQFIADAPLFAGDTTFERAAIALDTTAQLFGRLDSDGDKVVSVDELQSLLEKTTDANKESLNWLLEHFDAFTAACFFESGITRDEIESARNVFHGLRHLHEKFGFSEEVSPDSLQHINADSIRDYLNSHKDELETHDRAGLEQLLVYLKTHKDRYP